jgi:PAS domain S-box-containing protein
MPTERISGLPVERNVEAELRLLAAIVTSSNDAIIGMTLEGIVTSWNRAAERIFGYRPDEVIGGSVFVLAAPDRGDEMPSILGRIRRGERIEHYETTRRRKDGTPVEISLTVSPVHDAGGWVAGVSKIARDITERRRAEAELRPLNQTLRRRVARRTTALRAADRQLRAEKEERELTGARLRELQSEVFRTARLSVVGQLAGALAHELDQPLTAATNSLSAARRLLEVVARLFEPFVSTKPDGMGLGLSLCRSIVEAHGGRVRSERNLGGGTVFRFTLAGAPQTDRSDAG